MKFLCSFIEDVQTCFNGTQWDGSATVEVWVEASSCSCERVFSYMTAAGFGQSTDRMCEKLLVRCNGEAPEDWVLFEVLMISGRPLSASANGSKGMWLRWKMVVCLGFFF